MYRTIDTMTWGDPWFSELEPRAKLLFLYLITNDRTASCGTVEVTPRVAEFETGLTQYAKSISLLSPKVIYWPEFNIAWVRRFYKHQRANSSWKFDVSVRKAMLSLPEVVRETIIAEYPILAPQGGETGKGMDTHPVGIGSLSIPYAYPIDRVSTEQNRTEPETESEPETELEKPPVSLRSTSPAAKGGRIPNAWPDPSDADAFLTFGESLGLTMGQIAEHIAEYHDFWEQSTLKTATSLDWFKRWKTKIRQDIREGRVGGNAAPNNAGKYRTNTGKNGVYQPPQPAYNGPTMTTKGVRD